MRQTVTTVTNHRRVIAGLTAALLACAPVAAMGTDLRSPDARDAAALSQRSTQRTPVRTDLRSPDAIDASARVITTHRGDAGYVGLHTRAPQTPVPAAARAARAPHSSDPGLAWGYVALMVALALVAGMGLNETLRRQRLGRLLSPRA